MDVFFHIILLFYYDWRQPKQQHALRSDYNYSSTAVRLLIKGHWGHSDVTRYPQSVTVIYLFIYLGLSAAAHDR